MVQELDSKPNSPCPEWISLSTLVPLFLPAMACLGWEMRQGLSWKELPYCLSPRLQLARARRKKESCQGKDFLSPYVLSTSHHSQEKGGKNSWDGLNGWYPFKPDNTTAEVLLRWGYQGLSPTCSTQSPIWRSDFSSPWDLPLKLTMLHPSKAWGIKVW